MSDPVAPDVSPGPEFFTDFVVTGAVAGADATSTPAEVTRLLGDGFVESSTGPGQLLRCYDLVGLQLTAPAWFAPGPRGEPSPWSREAGRDRIRHLAGLGAPERVAWARRQPEEADEAARRWWSLWVACRQQLPGEGAQSHGHDRSVWRELALWLLGKCEATGVLDRTEAVCEIARYELLDPDAAVRACLDAITVSRADVATRETTPYTRENLVAVNASRAARRLSLAAGALLPLVRDPELRAEVRAWLELRPRLM